jgi:hypothetical protein
MIDCLPHPLPVCALRMPKKKDLHGMIADAILHVSELGEVRP